MEKLPWNLNTQGVDAVRRLADYEKVFEVLSKVGKSMDEKGVVEVFFELFSFICIPDSMIYLAIRNGKARKMIFHSRVPIDLEGIKMRMLRLNTQYAKTPKGKGFDLQLGEGEERAVLEIEGVTTLAYLDYYLDLALSVAPVLELGLASARNFQLLQREESRVRSSNYAREMVLKTVSQDLRNLLKAIELSAKSIERRSSSATPGIQVAHHAQSILHSARRMNRLMNDLLEWSPI